MARGFSPIVYHFCPVEQNIKVLLDFFQKIAGRGAGPVKEEREAFPEKVSKQWRQTIRGMICRNEFAIPGGRACTESAQPQMLPVCRKPPAQAKSERACCGQIVPDTEISSARNEKIRPMSENIGRKENSAVPPKFRENPCAPPSGNGFPNNGGTPPPLTATGSGTGLSGDFAVRFTGIHTSHPLSGHPRGSYCS